MALRLGIDFGTATTCVATIANQTEFRPDVVAINGTDQLADSLVWVAQPTNSLPIVRSRNTLGRSPISVFETANSSFWHYWQERVKAQTDGVQWHAWLRNRREESMLLSYFKPELADSPPSQTAQFVDAIQSTFDPMSQSEDVSTYYRTRVIANPAPDTHDLVAATAAIIRESVKACYLRYQTKVELIVLGIPSHHIVVGNVEAELSANRRLEAIELSGIVEDFGTPEFRAELFGEAQAAGFGIEMDAADTPELYAIIIDVGAGTTDMALVPYRRDRGKRFLAVEPIAHDSLRFGGRDLNEAIAQSLRREKDVERAYKAMDDRSWQILMEEDVERIKRSLFNGPHCFRIAFHRYAAAIDDGPWNNPVRRALLKTVFLERDDWIDVISRQVRRSCTAWKRAVSGFLRASRDMLGSRDVVAIEMVGGAFKFPPLREALGEAMRLADMDDVESRYRQEGDESQTVVARGLARRAMLMP